MSKLRPNEIAVKAAERGAARHAELPPVHCSVLHAPPDGPRATVGLRTSIRTFALRLKPEDG